VTEPHGRRPLIVVEGPPMCSDRDAARLRALGYDLVDGFASTRHATGWTVCRGVVGSDADAAAAVLAALAGHGLLIEATAGQATISRLLDDLRHLGPSVDHRLIDDHVGSPLEPESRSILALLAEGLTLGEAAAALNIARRTADRRLAAARRALGTDRTTEAIARARRQGWLG
jgi:DNA-binding NarL/FixJ family response regulator